MSIPVSYWKLFLAFFVVNHLIAQSVRKVSATMTMRTAHKGKTINTRAELCYATSGRMVTLFPKPAELYVFNNSNGEITVSYTHLDVYKRQVLCVTFISAMRLKVHAKNLRRIEICTTYWHFLDILWLYLFAFLLYFR